MFLGSCFPTVGHQPIVINLVLVIVIFHRCHLWDLVSHCWCHKVPQSSCHGKRNLQGQGGGAHGQRAAAGAGGGQLPAVGGLQVPQSSFLRKSSRKGFYWCLIMIYDVGFCYWIILLIMMFDWKKRFPQVELKLWCTFWCCLSTLANQAERIIPQGFIVHDRLQWFGCICEILWVCVFLFHLAITERNRKNW